MNIADSGYNINISGVRPAGGQGNQNIQNQEAAQQAAKGTATGEVSANALISTAKEGQSFNGQILDITNDQVKILLDNNTTLNARMAEAVNLNIGDSLSFLIKENNGSNVLIKPFNQDANLMKDSAIFNVLERNNLTPSEKNYQIAESLMNNSMPVDKSSMQKIMQQSYKYPDASIDTLVNLNKLGLPVNETSISQYNDYVSNSHQLSNDINNINNSILEFSTEIINNMGAGFDNGMTNDTILQMLDFNDTLLSTLSDAEDMANISGETSDLAKNVSENATVSENVSDSIINNLSEDIINSKTDNLSNNITNNLSDNVVNQTANQPVDEQNIMLDSLMARGIDVKASAEKMEINPESLKDIYEGLSKLGVSDDAIKNIANESKTPLQLLNNINKAISESFKENPESFNLNDIKQFFTSEEYNKVLSGGINKKFTLDTKDMKNPSEIDDLYKSMYE